jgi:hypothetical protein
MQSRSPQHQRRLAKATILALVAVTAHAATTSRAWADDDGPAPAAPAPRLTTPAEVPQTRPAAAVVTPLPRTMVWDRVKQEAQMAKELADLQRSLKVAQERAAGQPDDPVNKAVVARAQRNLADARERITKQQQELAKAHEAMLVKAAYLGIATSPAPPVLRKQLKLAEGMGLVVDFVDPGSPAETAGVQPYDVAVRLNEQMLINAPQLAVLVRTFEPGDEVTLTVIREGKETPLKVKLVERAVKPIADVEFGPMWTYEARKPRPVDVIRHRLAQADYTIKTGDILNVTIYDLEGPGLQTTMRSIVGKDGQLRVPWVNAPVTVRGLSELDTQQAISDAYKKAGVLENANVSVEVTPAADATIDMKMKARRDMFNADAEREAERTAPQPQPAPVRR